MNSIAYSGYYKIHFVHFVSHKPNEKFIKIVQKSAAARGLTVAEYRDKILFPHGKERIIKRFEQYYRLKNKAKK